MPSPQRTICTEKDYYNTPEDIRAELIDGQLYCQAATNRIHQKILNYLSTEINLYIRSMNGSCEVYPAPFAVKLYEQRDTIVEPDISIICDPHKLTDRGCTGAPDWIIEIISPGNPEHDYLYKLNLYKNAGVREYWIVDPQYQEVLVYYFEQGKFESYTFQDKIKANLYSDLWIDLKGLVK